MDLAEMNVKIGGDIASIQSALNTLTQNFTAFNGTIGKTSVVLDQVTRNLAQTTAASAATSGGVRSLGSEASLSTRHALGFAQGLTELAADANQGKVNLNGFFEILRVGASEFRVIQKETGSTIEGFKALGGAIFSEEAVILLVVTALAKLASYFLEANAKTKEHKETIDAYTQSLNESYKAAGQQLSQVSELVAAGEKQNASDKERKKVLEDLQNSSSTYFGNLKIENGLIIGLAEAYSNYADNILKVARAKAGEETIQKLSSELIKTTDSVNTIDEGFTNLNLTIKQAGTLLQGSSSANGFNNLAAAAKKVNDIVQSGLPTFEQIKLLSDLTGKSEDQVNSLLSKRRDLKTDEAGLTAQIATLSQFIATNDDKNFKSYTDAKPKIDEVAKALYELKNELKEIDLSEGIGADPVKRYEDIYNTIKKLLDLKVPEGSSIIQQLIGDADTIYVDNITKFKNGFLDKILKAVDAVKPPYLPVEIQPVYNKQAFQDILNRAQVEIEANTLHLNIDTSAFSGNEISTLLKPLQQLHEINLKLQQDFGIGLPADVKILQEGFQQAAANAQGLLDSNQALTDFINTTAIQSFESFGAAIGTALANGNVTGIFENLLNQIGEGVKTLGEAMIKAGVEMEAIKLSFKTLNPVLAIGAGIALVALGTFVESKAPKLAAGAVIPLGYPNDSFPAWLSSNEAVIPLDKGLAPYLNTEGSTNVVVLETRVSGDDIYLSQSRVAKRRGRSY